MKTKESETGRTSKIRKTVHKPTQILPLSTTLVTATSTSISPPSISAMGTRTPGAAKRRAELSWWPPVEVPPNGLDRLWKRRQSAQATFVVAVFFQRTSDIKHMMKTCLLILAPLEDLNAGQNLPGACVYWFPKGLNHYPLSLNSILVAIWC